MVDADIKEKFHDALEYFYDKNFHLAGRVSRLGYPEIIRNGYPPTAGVFWDDKKKKARFVFNEPFFNTLTEEEQLYFVIAHEAMHILNGHIFILKSEFDKMKAQGKSMGEIRKWQKKFNIAADCVVNDTLTNLYGLPRIECAGWHEYAVTKEITVADLCLQAKVPQKYFFEYNEDLEPDSLLLKNQKIRIPVVILYGQNIVGCDCHDLSVSDVIDLLPSSESEGEGNSDEQSDGQGEANDVKNHDMWDSFFNDDGSINEDFVDAMRDFVEENLENSNTSQEDVQVLEELEEKMKNCTDSYASTVTAQVKQKRIDFQKASLRWDKILFKKVARGKYEDVWSKTNRKLSSFYPDVILPYNSPKDVEDIFVAIDVSGSIDYAGTNLFVSLIKNTPKQFKIKAVTFNTVCTPFDLKSQKLNVGGGTLFSCIEEYIQNNFKKYPKAVFVLTDGDGGFVEPEYSSRWTWLLYSSCVTRYIQGMSYYKIKDLLA